MHKQRPFFLCNGWVIIGSMTDKPTEERIRSVIERFGLEPLPREGGFFRFISGFGNGAGMIYYMVTKDSFSHLHSLSEDEAWFFLEGDELEQTIVGSDMIVRKNKLNSENRTSIVQKNCFQATRIPRPVLGYSLVCTAMSPHYEDSMYTHGADVPQLREMKELGELL